MLKSIRREIKKKKKSEEGNVQNFWKNLNCEDVLRRRRRPLFKCFMMQIVMMDKWFNPKWQLLFENKISRKPQKGQEWPFGRAF